MPSFQLLASLLELPRMLYIFFPRKQFMPLGELDSKGIYLGTASAVERKWVIKR